MYYALSDELKIIDSQSEYGVLTGNTIIVILYILDFKVFNIALN